MKKESKIKEAVIIDEKEDNSGKIIGIILISIIGVLAIAMIILGLVSSNKKESKNTISLKNTDSVTTTKNGVYITDVSEVVDAVMPSIVAITSKTVINSGSFGPFAGQSYTAEGAGSGVIIKEDDDEIFILTNYHVVEDTKELSVKFIDDESYDATIKGVSERKDIAVVSVSKKDIKESTLKEIK